MAEFFPPVIFEVKAKATEAIAEFGKVNAELTKMEKNGILAGGALGKMEKAGKLAGTAFLGLAGAIGVIGAVSLKALDSFDQSQVKLETAIKNTGVSFQAAEPVIKAHADSMKNLGFTYSETYDALTKMTAASGSPQLALNSLGVAADLARYKGMSLADAGTLIARASIGQAKGLGDLGIAIGKTIPKGASFEQILKAIEDRTGGLAKAFGDTLPGKLQIAKANFNALEISIGTGILPYARQFTDWIINTAIPHLKDFGNWFSQNLGLIKGFGIALGAIWATSKIIAFIGVLKDVIATMRALAVAAGIAGVAEAFATGGLSAVAATAALAGTAIPLIATGAAVYGAVKLDQILTGNKKSKPYDPMSGNTPSVPNLAGKGVTRVTTPAKGGKTSIKAQEKGTVGGSLNIKVGYNPHPDTVNAIAGNQR